MLLAVVLGLLPAAYDDDDADADTAALEDPTQGRRRPPPMILQRLVATAVRCFVSVDTLPAPSLSILLSRAMDLRPAVASSSSSSPAAAAACRRGCKCPRCGKPVVGPMLPFRSLLLLRPPIVLQ
jgi:hypothetical protein